MVPFSPVNAGQQNVKLRPIHIAAHCRIPKFVSCSNPCQLGFQISDKASQPHASLSLSSGFTSRVNFPSDPLDYGYLSELLGATRSSV
jgi:hypothetical protein